MSRIEWAIMAALFLAGCIYADTMNRRMKALQAKSCRCDCLSALLPELEKESECRKADRNDIQRQLDGLKAQCAACCSKCQCCPCSPCCCPKPQTGKKTSLIPRDAEIISVVIHEGQARFVWCDADGEHALTIPESELERVAVVDESE